MRLKMTDAGRGRVSETSFKALILILMLSIKYVPAGVVDEDVMMVR